MDRKKEPFINVGVIRNTNFTKDCKLDDADIAYLDVEVKQFNQRKLRYGDIILEKSGGSTNQPVGRVVLFDKKDGDFSFSNFTSAIRIKDKSILNFNFLHKYLSFLYFTGYTERLQSNTTGIRNLDFNRYKKTEIPIPPLPIQEAIVKELDILHRLKELQEQQLAEYDNLAQSTFYSMFGDPIENEKGWEMRKCEDLFEMKLGKMLSAKNYKGTHLKPYLRNVNVKWGELDLSDIKEMDFFDDEFEQYKLKKGDILVCEGGEVGRTAIYNGEIENCCYQNALHRLRILDEKEITREYFLYFMLIGVPQGLIKRLTISVTIQHFALVKFKNMKIPVPPFSLQTDFANRIEKIEAQKELVKQAIAENAVADRLYNG